MKHFLALFAVGALACAAETAAPLDRIVPEEGDTFVFLGDSITEQCLYTQYLEHYFHTRYPRLRMRFHNAGVSGDTAADALARFDRDVAFYKPKYVTVLLGMNDGASKHFETALFDAYRENMSQLLGRIRAIGATPILITPTMYDARMAAKSDKPDRRGRGGYYNGVLALYGAWLRDEACDRRCGFVDVHSLLNQFTIQSRKRDPAFTLIPDGIHPDAGGQIIMAYGIASDLGLSKRCSTIELTRAADGAGRSKVTGGKLTGARYTDDGVEFAFHPTSLPFAVADAAKGGADLIPLGHRLSYEALYIHGLAAGSYRMLINDADAGTFSADVLASKVEIESNPLTPQYQQALRVAALDARRNAEAVTPLRLLWRSRKVFERTKQELAAAPGDEALKKRLTAFGRRLVDFENQVREFDVKISAFDEEIYRANQPQTLRFRLVRIGDAK